MVAWLATPGVGRTCPIMALHTPTPEQLAGHVLPYAGASLAGTGCWLWYSAHHLPPRVSLQRPWWWWWLCWCVVVALLLLTDATAACVVRSSVVHMRDERVIQICSVCVLVRALLLMCIGSCRCVAD